MSKFKEITKEEQKERTNVQPRDGTLHGESMAQLNRKQIVHIIHVVLPNQFHSASYLLTGPLDVPLHLHKVGLVLGSSW
jgi:hypothetical protein